MNERTARFPAGKRAVRLFCLSVFCREQAAECPDEWQRHFCTKSIPNVPVSSLAKNRPFAILYKKKRIKLSFWPPKNDEIYYSSRL